MPILENLKLGARALPVGHLFSWYRIIALDSPLSVDHRASCAGPPGRQLSPSHEPLPGTSPSLTFIHSVNCRDTTSRRRSFVMADSSQSSGQGPELQAGRHLRESLQKLSACPFRLRSACYTSPLRMSTALLLTCRPMPLSARALIIVITSCLQGFPGAHHRRFCAIAQVPVALVTSCILTCSHAAPPPPPRGQQVGIGRRPFLFTPLPGECCCYSSWLNGVSPMFGDNPASLVYLPRVGYSPIDGLNGLSVASLYRS